MGVQILKINLKQTDMIGLKGKLLDALTVGWITAGLIVFVIGWCRWYYAVPLTSLILWCLVRMYKRGEGQVVLMISARQLGIVSFTCFVLMALSGIGGYVVQSADNYWRNAMFRDLVNYSWPVYDELTGLTKSYYLAFWMIPALFAKLFHSIEIGFFCQLLWVSIGFILLFLQISRWIGKPRLSYLVFFYLFSGLKIAECLLYFPFFGEGSFLSNTIDFISTNSTPGSFHAGPIVQFLYDPFNQTIPLFLGIIWMLNNSRSKEMAFVFSLLLLYAPLPLVGLAPIVIYWMARNVQSEKQSRRTGYIFNIENITGFTILILSILYLMSNNNSGHKGLRPIVNLSADIYSFILYIIFEFAIIMAISYKACQDKIVLWIAFVSVCIFGWFQLGLHNDFCFRTNMPLIFLLCLLLMKRYYMDNTSRKLKGIIIVWIILAGIPTQIHPTLRWISSVYILSGHQQAELNKYQSIKDVTKLYVMQQRSLRNNDLQSSFRCRPDQYEFRTDVGTPSSFFFKYLAKQTIAGK